MSSQQPLWCSLKGSQPLLLLLLIISLLIASPGSQVNAFLVVPFAVRQRAAQQTSSLQSASPAAGATTPMGNESGEWLKHGLLMSSFSDGLKPNPHAIDFLMRGLVASLWKEHRQRKAEEAVTESVRQSPCCGPNLDVLKSMEIADTALLDLEEGRTPWKDVLNDLVDGTQELRFLYIPTAMYAIRQDSTQSPGIQRQRARADGKKRRNEIVHLLSCQLEGKVPIRVVTLDLDDSSIKQPDGHDDATTIPKVRLLILFNDVRFTVYTNY